MQKLIYGILTILFVYWAISTVAFEIRNPKANRVQPIMHPISVLKWEKLPEFQ